MMGMLTMRLPDNLEKEMDCYIHKIASCRSEFVRKSIKLQIKEIKKNEKDGN